MYRVRHKAAPLGPVSPPGEWCPCRGCVDRPGPTPYHFGEGLSVSLAFCDNDGYELFTYVNRRSH
jgi:hypothetical protein